MTPYLPLFAYNQFIIWKLTDDNIKIPCTLTGYAGNAHDPVNWTDFATATSLAEFFGKRYAVGFVFTEADPFWAVDIDGCLQADGQWSPLATELMSLLRGALVEVSQSGKGLHIIGTGAIPNHAKKNTALHIECYHAERFLALGNMQTAVGDAGCDLTPILPTLVNTYFPPIMGADGVIGWSESPVPEWNGPTSNEELIERMLNSTSASSAFGSGASFRDLWDANSEVLSRAFPAIGDGVWDGSSADASLAQHLAFWTGKDCERIRVLMQMSGLVRSKWDREDYLYRTILRAVSLQTSVYQAPKEAEVERIAHLGPCKLKGSEAQIKFAENVRVEKVLSCADQVIATQLCQMPNASFWIDHRDKTVEQLIALIAPEVEVPMGTIEEITIRSGLQFLAASQQIEMFKGCVFISDANRVFMPDGRMLTPQVFNATWGGGYRYQLDDVENKTTKSAFEAFTQSQIVTYPIAHSTCFRPEELSGSIVDINGRPHVNTYVPIKTPIKKGEASKFLTHVSKLLPDFRDQQIILSYMAAIIQYKGKKFQWAPMIQGTQGNGKSLLTRCIIMAIGEAHCHEPRADEIGEKFNAWYFDKIFIGVEDVYVPSHKREVLEVLKPMITNTRLAKRAMQQDQVTADARANFILNSNHKDAIVKTKDDRRFAVFYTAQQSVEDLKRDGMTEAEYFVPLYRWLWEEDGFAIVHHYLANYKIDPLYNPAGDCVRAPITSSYFEATEASLGTVEHAIREAVNEGMVGMLGGWLSSVALDTFLKPFKFAPPINKRRLMLEEMGYVLHPYLHEGRVNSPSAIDGNKKPRLYVKAGHPSLEVTSPSEILKLYIEAQGVF